MKKRILSAVMVLLLLVSLTACGYESMLNGMVGALTAMSTEKNTETVVVVKCDNGGKDTLTYDKVFELLGDAVTNAGMIGVSDTEDVDFNIDMQLTYAIDENANMRLDIALPSGKSYKSLLNLYFVDNTVYIGTGIIAQVIDLVGDETLAEALSVITAKDYLAISATDLNTTGFVEVEDSTIDTTKEALLNSIDTLTAAIKENAPKVITKDLKILSMKDGYYVLSMDDKQAKEVGKAIIDIVDASALEIADFLNELVPTDTPYTAGMIREAINEAKNSEQVEEVEEYTGNFVYKVKADKNTQDMALTLNLKSVDTAEVLNLAMTMHTKILPNGVHIPTGTIIGLDELLNDETFLYGIMGGLLTMDSGAGFLDTAWDTEVAEDVDFEWDWDTATSWDSTSDWDFGDIDEETLNSLLGELDEETWNSLLGEIDEETLNRLLGEMDSIQGNESSAQDSGWGAGLGN